MVAPTPWDPAATPYPAVRRDESFVETFKNEQGPVDVKDPYHYLAEPPSTSDETAAFVKAQGDFTRQYTAQNKDADNFKRELTKNWDYPRCASPSAHPASAARWGTPS